MATFEWIDRAKEEDRKRLQAELDEMNVWFQSYDTQVAQYLRSQRLKEKFDKDIGSLDQTAKAYQLRIREIRYIMAKR